MLLQIGPDTQDIIERIPEKREDFDTVFTKLNDFPAPKNNVDYEIFQSRQAIQMPGETVGQYAKKLESSN